MSSIENTQEERRKLRSRLARRLKMDDVPEPLWEELEERYHVLEALEEPDRIEEFLVKPAKKIVRKTKNLAPYLGLGPVELGSERARHERADKSYVPTLLAGDLTYERARAIGSYLVKRYETFPEVRDIRQKLDAPVSEEEAHDFFRAPESSIGPGPLKDLVHIWNGTYRGSKLVDQGSLLWELYDTAEQLACGLWRPEHIAWWLLTGEVEVRPFYAVFKTGRDWPTFELTVPAWASAGAVGKFYKEAKEEMLSEPFAPTPSHRRLAIFRFVAERGEYSEAEGSIKPDSWRNAMNQWNQAHPEHPAWRYTDVRNFREAFKEAEKALFRGEFLHSV